MGYESRVLIVNRNEIERIDGTHYVYVEQIGDIKMSCMPNGFINLFDNKIDYKLFVDNANKKTQTDRYGDIMTYTDCKTIINYLENLITSGENHRRLTMLLGLLKGINEKQWTNIQVVHYGY